MRRKIRAVVLLKRVRAAVLLLATLAEAALRALVEQGDGTVPPSVAVPSLRVLVALLAWLRRGE